ncbi:MAG: ABC transporter ATP-binding protein/permease [Bacteroidia bacterium]|nr:ABC transporter ATP-binding protein/permease [Bacteroidia bacterium]
MSEQSVSGKAFDQGLLRRLLGYVKPYRLRFAGALGLTIFLAVLAPVRPWLVQMGLDQYVAFGDVAGLRTIVLSIFGILLMESIIMYRNTYLTNWLGQSIIRDIREQVFRHILSLKLTYFDRTPIGTLQTRTINDVETLNDVFTSGLVRILGDLLQLTAILVVMLWLNWKLTLVTLITLPLMIVSTIIFKNKVKVAFTTVRKAVSDMNAFLQEHITGMPIVHIFNREDEEARRFDEVNNKYNDANIKSVLYYSIYFPVMEIIIALSIGLLVWYGAGNVLDGEVTAGQLVAFIMYTQMFFRPLRQLADQFNTLQLGMVSAERIFKILDTDEFIPNTGTETSFDESNQGVSITFENVWFAYIKEDWVLKDVSFHLEPGDKLALVGSTGSGKSTIINLISRFYDIQKGRILINGKDAKSYELDTLRALCGVVLQDVFLFSGSVHDNITLNNDALPREQVVTAAKQVGADAFINRLPDGYEYNVRERGATLSLGQRQLIAFARVMTYNPRVLVLDEATANIDTESEEVIQQAVDTVMAGRTSIIIAHRLSTIQKADKILVLSKGEIVETGNHEELLEKQGAYFQLHQMQFAS